MKNNQNIKLHVVLDNIRSVFNVGSVFRTADAVGNVKLYLCGMTATPDHIKIKKTALGSTESVQWEYFHNTTDAIQHIKSLNIDAKDFIDKTDTKDISQNNSIPVYAVELTPEAKHFQQIQYPTPVALVFGHERRGVDQRVLDLCDECIMIPMAGIKESLNVSTTAGILMYEAIREKKS
jgi:23S rRNA (guanosine2251-2'-O)-methyltransferase